MVAYYLLQITQGIFKWNGELFFCPFVSLEDKKKPLQPTTWNKIGWLDRKWSLPFTDKHNILWLFADPVDPLTYTRTKQRLMDKSLGINNETIVYKKGFKMIINYKGKIDTLEFVKKISDPERSRIFDPNSKTENFLRYAILKSSSHDNDFSYKSHSIDTWLREYNLHKNPTNDSIAYKATVAAVSGLDRAIFKAYPEEGGGD